MSDLSVLLERLRAATGGDRELNGDIWWALSPIHSGRAFQNASPGLPRPLDHDKPIPAGLGRLGVRTSAPDYTGSLDSALALVQAKLPGWEWVVAQHSGKCWACVQPGGQDEFGGPEHVEHPGEAATPALSLLVALLVALIAEQTSDAL